MFTGIIQAIGEVKNKIIHNEGTTFIVSSNQLDFSTVEIGNSIAVNGVCLTATKINNSSFECDVSKETLNCSTLGDLSVDDYVNLEKSLRLDQGIDGHLVAGHVDGKGEITDKIKAGNSIRFKVKAPKLLVKYIAIKGSIAINGVSLTINNIKENIFDVNIIPHTLTSTTLKHLKIGDNVNLEIDIISRYLEKLMSNKNES
jgi:riboflavin synthase